MIDPNPVETAPCSYSIGGDRSTGEGMPMKVAWISAAAALVVLVPPSTVLAQDSPGSMFDGEVEPPPPSFRTERYDRGRGRVIEISRARSRQPAPVLLILDDIGWRSGASNYNMHHFVRALNDRGIAVAFLNSDEDTATADVENISSALRLLPSIADKHRLDTRRMAVLGRGSGGHLAALLATDPTLTDNASLARDSVRAAILIDAEGFDVERLMSDRPQDRRFLAYFGSDPASWKKHSPAAQLAAPNAPLFYFINYAAARSRAAPAVDFGRAVEATGARVIVRTTITADGNIGGKRFGSPGNRTSDELINELVDLLR